MRCLDRVSARRLAGERRVRTRRVVAGDPGIDRPAGMHKIGEEHLIEQFVPHPAVEGFDVAVLHGLPWCDAVPLDPMPFRPGQHGVGRKLGAVIGDDHPRLATPLDERRQLAGNPSARDRGVGDGRQAFESDIVHHVQDAEAAAVGEPAVHEVQ